MAAPTTFGATVVGAKPATDTRPVNTPAASQYSLDLTESQHFVPPRSPFYQHPPASHERVAKFDKSLDISVTEKGLSCDELTPMSARAHDPFSSSITVNANKECTMWPSRKTLEEKHMSDKKKKRAARFCACAGPRHRWETMSTKQKLGVSIVIALLLIGAMIGMGVGISKSVHGYYYTSSSSKTSM